MTASWVLAACSLTCGGGPRLPPSLPPQIVATAHEALTPCDVAREERRRLPKLRLQGKLHRTLRVIDRVLLLCPAEASSVRGVQQETLSELTADDKRDPHEAYAAGRRARDAGDDAAAQRAFDRAVFAFERVHGEDVQVGATNELPLLDGLAWSPDDALVATAGQGNLVVIDVGSGATLAHFDAGIGWLNKVRFSPDGSYLAASGYEGAIKLWKLPSMDEMRVLQLPPHPGAGDTNNRVWAMDIDASGDLLATGSWGGDLRVWNTRDGSVVHQLEAQQGGVEALALSRDGKRLVTSGRTGGISLWDVSQGKKLHDIRAEATSLALRGDVMATVHSFRQVDVWDLRTRQVTRTIRADELALAVALSPDGASIATGHHDGHATLWNAHTGVRAHDLRAPVLKEAVLSPQLIEDVAFSNDGHSLATAGNSRLVRRWDVASGKLVGTFGDHGADVDDVAFAGDGTAVAVAVWFGRARLWDPRQATLSRPLADHAVAVALSDDARSAATATNDRVTVYDVSTAKKRRTFQIPKEAVLESPFRRGVRRPNQHSGLHDGTPLALTRNGSHVAYATREGAVHVWSVADGKRLSIDPRLRRPAAYVRFTPDGTRVVTMQAYGEAQVTPLDGGDPVKVDLSGAGASNRKSGMVVFDDHAFVIGTYEATLTKWSLADGKATVFQISKAGHDMRFAVSADQRRAAFAKGEAIIVWDLQNNKLLQTLKGHDDDVRAFAFTADGSRLWTGAGDETLRLWDIGAGRQLLLMRGLRDADAGYAIDPQGNVELFGAPGVAAGRLSCRFGRHGYPFELCAERAIVPGLTAAATNGDALPPP